jgi:tRNA(Ile)-lysidine synthase
MRRPLAPLPFNQQLSRAYAQLARAGDRVLLAVSGGADSTALAVGSAQVAEIAGLKFAVACVDHGLREGSDRELLAVEGLARRFGMPFYGRAADVSKRGNLEDQARRARYAALESARREAGAAWVATAHTATDQLETVLMKLFRGSSLRGARGVHVSQGRILRPLLGVTREACRSFLEQQGVSWVEDPMNSNPRFQRVRLRQGVLPAIAALGDPEVALRVSRFAQGAAEDEALLEAMSQRQLGRLTLDGNALDVVALRALEAPIQRRVLRAWLEAQGLQVSGNLLERTGTMLRDGGAVGLGSDRLVAEGGRLRRVVGGTGADGAKPEVEELVSLTGTGLFSFGQWKLGRSQAPPAGPPSLVFPVPLERPLAIRARRPGDRVRGPRGSRSLQDLFVDAKVPREDRASWPVVCDGTTLEPLWLVGVWPTQHRQVQGPCVWAARI